MGMDARLVLVDPDRATTIKERFMGRAGNRHPQQILRVDREIRTPLTAAMEDKFLVRVLAELAHFDAVLISDYGKGTCTPRLLQAVIVAARKFGIPVLVDPARGASYDRYRGAY